jgi:beta-galactosidase
MQPDQPSIALAVPERPPTPEAGYLNLGRFQHPSRTLTVNSRHLVLDGQPWLPVMGEFHYSRCPSDEWAAELAKVRAGGVQVVASYVIWNHHEPLEGAWRWDGQRHLARFVQEAARAGLLVYLRPGPWVHAEVRHGGFPLWLDGATRCNDDAYLGHVARWFEQVARQLQGLLWHEGGPVIGIQLENEYGGTGPGRGAEHIAALKRLAIAAGLQVPLYTVTGWPTLDFPAQEVLPVSGAYADGFWQGAQGPLPPSGVFLFNTQRVIGEMGNVDGTPATGAIDPDRYPFCLAEAGGGMHQSYHRRPVVTPDDVYATALVQIGSGANLYGYYMYHGGTNPACETGPLNESQVTGYPNDVPEWGYDFHAPLGQYGQVRASWGRQRLLHTFCAAFGAGLARLGAELPADAPRDPTDLSKPRVAARVAGRDAASVEGYVFVNHHVRHHPLPAMPGQCIELAPGSGETIRLPLTDTFDLQPGMAFIWPVGQRLGTTRLAQATVQPFTRWHAGAEATWVGVAIPGLPAELVFDRAGLRSLVSPGAEITEVGSQWHVRLEALLTPQALSIVDAAGARHLVLVLPQGWAERCAHTRLAGRDRLLFASHAATWDDAGTCVTLARPLHEHGFVRVYPADGLAGTREPLGVEWAGWHWSESTPLPAGPWPASTRQTRTALEPPAVRYGPPVAWRDGPVPTVPAPRAWEAAAAWTLALPGEVSDAGRLWLTLDLVCDIARLKIDGRVVDDRFGDGSPWVIGLHRWPRGARIELELLPLREGAPIFLEPGARTGGALLRSATLVAECSHTVNLVPEA